MEGYRIVRTDAEEKRARIRLPASAAAIPQPMPLRPSATLLQDHSRYIGRRGAEGQADPDLIGSLRDGITQHAPDS